MRKTHQAVLSVIFLLVSGWGCVTAPQMKDAADVGEGPGGSLKRMTALMQTPVDQRPTAAPAKGAAASPSPGDGGPGASLKQMLAAMGSQTGKRPTAIAAGGESASSSSGGSLQDKSGPPVDSSPTIPAAPPAAAMAPETSPAETGEVVQSTPPPVPLPVPRGEEQARGTVQSSTLRTEIAAVTPSIPDPALSAPRPFRREIFSAEPAYRLGPEDVVHVSVWESPELTTDATVKPDGKISLPLINDIQAAGSTPAELADAISRKLLEYIKDPHVTVVVTQLIATKFYVMGNVLKPGNYPLRQEMNVLQALSLAGGFTTFASPRSIKLIRSNGNGQEILRINYYKMIKENGEGNYMLKPGDTIVVP
jgi:polysaccharide export outer membrane protein